MRSLWIGAIVLAVPLAWLVIRQQQEAARSDQVAETLEHGDHLEQNQRWSEAIQVYLAALDLQLQEDERADLRYRLARSQIEGNDLNGALGVLQELTTESVARFQMDIGPLYFQLAERARASGNLQLAMIANRQGTAVSPARVEQFMGQREDLANQFRNDAEPPPPDDEQEEKENGG